jgi:hypothetical protein
LLFYWGAVCVVGSFEGFQDSANAPPIMASSPPGAVTTPISEMIPKMIMTMPHVVVDRGLLFIMNAPMIMIIPKARNA